MPALVRETPRAATVAAAASRHIPSLDGIRAGSFLLVFGSHALSSRWLPGQLGVTVFFFLSGFLITTLMRAEFDKTGAVSLGHFWLRRALRILPPLYLVILGSALLALAVYPPGTVSASAKAAQLLFYANYYDGFPDVPGTAVVWSLAVEEHFYLLFPLLYLAMQRRQLSPRQQAWTLWAMCALVLVWRCVLVMALHVPSARIFTATDTRIDSILFGCALAVWNNPALDKGGPAPNVLKYLLLPGALLVLLGCAYSGATTFAATWSFSLEGAALTVIFIGAIRLHSWAPFRILNWRPVAFLGVLSYSLYLVHDVLLQAVTRSGKLPHASIRALAALMLSLLVAWTIYELVEKPCARLRRRLTDW
ncbi:MAG: acyltransferase [Gammaproteobacteria bacterium]|nr:acyltransferase [Gammaproteobacteria bacterium]